MNEQNLNSFYDQERKEEFDIVVNEFKNGDIKVKPENDSHNMHCHTTFSYNGYDFSPCYIACLAKKEGWFGVGIVDFDERNTIPFQDRLPGKL